MISRVLRRRSRVLACVTPLLALLSMLFSFATTRRAEALIITEIMYHPSAAQEAEVGGRNLEWIEIYNDEPTIVNLEGWWFSRGVTFRFPFNTYLEGRSYLVVCADEEAVREKYGITNTIGDFGGRLDNNGEGIAVNIYGGGPDVTVEYSDSGQWPKEADGTGHTLTLIDVYEDPNDNDNWTYSGNLGGTPGAPNFETIILENEIFGDDEVWRFRRNTTDYPAGWFEPDFDDGEWDSGQTGIGYADNDDRTVLDDMRGNYQSFAARFRFEITQEQIDEFESVVFKARFDDGMVVFLNGEEIIRVGLGDPGEPFDHETSGRSHEANREWPYEIDIDRFIVGENVFAVGIHNATLSSSDCSFIPRLVNETEFRPGASGPPVHVVINECLSRTDDDGWVELYNTSDSTIDLSGFHLSDDNNLLDKFVIPDETTIPGDGFLVFTASETGLDFTALDLSLFLTRPTLDEVIDAARFTNDPERVPSRAGMSEALFPDGGDRFFVATTPTPGAPNEVTFVDDIVINEILYHPPREYPDIKFLELHNRGDSDVDLSGFRFTRGISFTIPDEIVLSSGGYLVVAENPEALEEAHGIENVLGPWEGTLVQSNENVRLVDPLGNLVDEVHYFDGGEWPPWADGGGSSLELIDPDQDNSVASAWEASDESTKSEWVEIEYDLRYTAQSESEFQIRMLSAGELLVDDVTVTRDGTQYIRNPTFESSTSTWLIDGNHIQSHRTTEDAFGGDASLKIVATGKGDTRVNRIETETSPRMSSGTHAVHVAAKWLRGGNLIFFSCYAQPANCQRSFWLPIPENLGTPGAQNSQHVENLGPVISEVMHSPAVPAANTPARIVATVTDSDGVASVSAVYSSSRGDEGTVELRDDGGSGDGEAGDGVYGGQIPGFSNSTKVNYYVEAEDDTGAQRRSPREAPSKEYVYGHSTPATSNAFTFRVIHDNVTWSRLNSRRLHSNELLDATFVFNEDKVFYNVGTRFRGSPWNRPGNPRMYRVSFGKDNTYRRRRKINLSRYGSGQNERAAGYAVWRNSTTTAPSPFNRASWGRVTTNGGTWTMEAQDPWGTDLLKLWFPEDSDGYLMKITGKQIFDDGGNHRSNLLRWADYSNRGTDKGNYRWNWNPRTRELEDNFTPLVTLVQHMNTSATNLDNNLENVMDVEQFFRVYAARCAHDDWDTIAIGNGQNMYVYYAVQEQRWKLLPWDMDHSWGNVNARTRPDNDAAMRNILNRPKYSRLYSRVVNEMLNGIGGNPGHWSAAEMVSKFLDRNSQVVSRSPDSVGSAGGIRNFVNNRISRLRSLVPGRVTFSISTEGGDDHAVNTSWVRLDGRGWVDVDVVLVNGESVELAWPSTTSWRIPRLDLGVGENDFEIVALDVEGNVVGTDTIAITSTVGWEPPEITEAAPLAGQPGAMIDVQGVGFHAGITASFNGVPSPNVEFDEKVDPTTARVEVPLVPDGVVDLVVTNVDERNSEPIEFTVLEAPPEFIRGDANMDERIDISDGVRIVRHLFGGVSATCRDALDADNDNELAVTDAVRVLAYIYQAGEAPAAPFPEQGRDPDDDADIDCEEGVDLFD